MPVYQNTHKLYKNPCTHPTKASSPAFFSMSSIIRAIVRAWSCAWNSYIWMPGRFTWIHRAKYSKSKMVKTPSWSWSQMYRTERCLKSTGKSSGCKAVSNYVIVRKLVAWSLRILENSSAMNSLMPALMSYSLSLFPITLFQITLLTNFYL